MEFADELLRRIEKKKKDVERLENDLREGQAYLRALEDTYRLIDSSGEEGTTAALRPGSDLARTQEIIKKANRAMHVSEILAALGKVADKKSKESLSGSLAAYVRKGQVFTKAGPNKFGLTEMGNVSKTANIVANAQQPPDDFGGLDQGVTDDDVPF